MGEGKEDAPPLNNHDEPCTVAEDEECGKELRVLDTFVSDVSRDEEEGSPVNSPKSTGCRSVWGCITAFFNTYSFMVYAAVGIILAYSYPPLGAVYVYPKITSSYVAVITIFLLSGIGLRTKELKNVYKNINFNIFVVVFNFGVVSAFVFGIAKFLLKVGALSEALAQGLIICGCLALTVNMVFILTAKAGGDEALGIFHAAFGNFIGVFLSPLLVLFYTGESASIDVKNAYKDLFLKVIIPLIVGQIMQYFIPVLAKFYEKHRSRFTLVQELALVYIIFTTFSITFYKGVSGTTIGEVFIMIGTVFFCMISLMTLAWFSLKLLFRNKPKQRVMGLFGCTHKTLTVGVPLIQALYRNDPNIGIYILPILIWHPMQLFVGSSICPFLLSFVERETQRLKEEQVTG